MSGVSVDALRAAVAGAEPGSMAWDALARYEAEAARGDLGAEARAMGIRVLPPDINESLAHFTVLSDKAIRFGLTAIKGVGESSVREIIRIRDDEKAAGTGKFASIEDFARRIPAKILNKKTLEALAKSGALDSLGERGILVSQYDKIADYCKSSGDVGTMQDDLFGALDASAEAAKIVFDAQEPATAQQLLGWEKETLGLFVSNHPLAGLTKYIGKKAQLLNSLTADEKGRKVTIAGIVENVKTMRTKKGETMAIVTLEDPTGVVEVTLFPRTYGQAADLLVKPDSLIVVGGTLDIRAGQFNVRADAVKRSVLSTIVQHAKEEGFFDVDEAKNGLKRTRRAEDVVESIETIDDEGNVVRHAVQGTKAEPVANDWLGPLALWIAHGMNVEEPLKALENTGVMFDAMTKPAKKKIRSHDDDDDPPTPIDVTKISIFTIELPHEAPRELLLELKKIFEMFPGSEKIQLKIGDRILPVPHTVTISSILEHKIEEAVKKYVMV
jgi:hypothetical protein